MKLQIFRSSMRKLKSLNAVARHVSCFAAKVGAGQIATGHINPERLSVVFHSISVIRNWFCISLFLNQADEFSPQGIFTSVVVMT